MPTLWAFLWAGRSLWGSACDHPKGSKSSSWWIATAWEEKCLGGSSFALVRLLLLNKLAWAALGRSRRMVEWSLQSVFSDPRAVTRELVDEVFQVAKNRGRGRLGDPGRGTRSGGGDSVATSSTG